MKNKITTTIIIILLILLKIYLISVQPIKYIPENKYDDALMLKQANSILQGKWLGEYNSLTLVKGPITPIFIAILNKLHIPFLIGQELLYDVSCLFVIYTFSKTIKNKKILYIIFAILLFNPVTFSTEICRVYRDGISTSLTMLLIGFSYSIFLNRENSPKKQIKYFIGLGITLSALYLCREESIWILPFVIISTITTIIFIIKDKKIKSSKILIGMYAIPIAIFIINNLTICTVNYKNYGVFELNQYWSKEFKEAYGAITRVIPNEIYSKVPVSQETIKRICEISPKFKEIEEYLTGEEADKWSKCGDGKIGEIQGGWIHWAIIKGVDAKGYYKDAKTANQYYKELANEINNAIDEGKIEGYKNKRVTNVPRFNFEDIINSIKKCKDTIRMENNFYLLKIVVQNRLSNDLQENEKWKNITREEIDTEITYNGTENQNRLNALKQIKNIYIKINPIMFKISLICVIGLIICSIINHNKIYNEILILLGLAGLYLCRIFIITFTYITMYTDALYTMYLANTYGVQILFSLLAIIFFVQNIKKKNDQNQETLKEKIKLNPKKDITILIPCLNEEKTIGICLKKAKQIIQQENLDAEILVVDNGCEDNSIKIAKKQGARVIKVDKKGYGNALRYGTIEAIRKICHNG